MFSALSSPLKFISWQKVILAFRTNSCSPLKTQPSITLFGKPSQCPQVLLIMSPAYLVFYISYSHGSWPKGWFYLSRNLWKVSGNVFDWYDLRLLHVRCGLRPVMLLNILKYTARTTIPQQRIAWSKCQQYCYWETLDYSTVLVACQNETWFFFLR